MPLWYERMMKGKKCSHTVEKNITEILQHSRQYKHRVSSQTNETFVVCATSCFALICALSFDFQIDIRISSAPLCIIKLILNECKVHTTKTDTNVQNIKCNG